MQVLLLSKHVVCLPHRMYQQGLSSYSAKQGDLQTPAAASADESKAYPRKWPMSAIFNMHCPVSSTVLHSQQHLR